MVRMSKQKRDKARTIVYVHDFLAFVSVLSAKESSARKLAGTVSVTARLLMRVWRLCSLSILPPHSQPCMRCLTLTVMAMQQSKTWRVCSRC